MSAGGEKLPHDAEARPPMPEPQAQRSSISGYTAAGIMLAALIVAVIVVVASGGGGNGSSSSFDPNYDDLDTRREAAGVSTMGAPADPEAHFHPRLTVYANGVQVPVPINIGIDPSQPPEAMASLHTHESEGTIHVEGMADPTLGQFFEIWGVPFSTSQLGPYRVEGSKTMRMWVDGEPSRAFGDLPLADGQEIVVAYGSPEQMPPAVKR